MLKLLFNIIILAVGLYISYRLIKSGTYYLKEALEIRKQLKRKEDHNG